MSASLVIRFVHLAAALTWVGGMLFVALVLVPVMRRLEDPLLRRRLMHDTGIRFRAVGWVALGVLVASGLVSLWLRPELLTLTRFWVKAALVTLAITLSVVHDFVLGPRAGRPDAPPALRARASWTARANLLLVLAVVALGLSFR